MPDPDEFDVNLNEGSEPEAPPEGLDMLNAHLHVDVDPELLEAALAAVERASTRPTGRRAAVDLDLEAPTEPERRRPEPPGPRELLLQGRVREQGERLARMDDELRRVIAARTEAEALLAELRGATLVLRDDFERFRQRARKDKDEAEKVGEERCLRQFLDTADNVERAWQHAEHAPERVFAGLQMIVEQFRTTLRRSGVERIPAAPGTIFDPEVHEAVLHVATDLHPPGTVADEASPGWKLRGRLLRAARVTVAAPVPESSVTFPGEHASSPSDDPGDPSPDPVE